MWDLPGIRDQTPVPCISRQILIHCTTRKVWHLSYLTCWFEKHNVVNSPYLCRKCLEKIRNKTSSKYTKFASILYSTQRMEWNLPWAKLKNCFFSLSDTFSYVFGKAERRTWTDSLQLQIYASNISLANGIILWLFFQREKKKKIFFFRPRGEVFLVILLFQHVDNCPFYLCCLLCIFWRCKKKKLNLLFKVLFLKCNIYSGQWSLLTSWCLRIKWTYISDYIVLWCFYKKKHSNTSFQN